ncbi:MAG: hypothetical protein ABIJ09_07215 [Pseudomonadota bacterium]
MGLRTRSGEALPRARVLSGLVVAMLLVPGFASSQQPVHSEADGAPELAPVESAAAIQRIWTDMRRAKNQANYSEVCVKLDMLRDLGQDLEASKPLAAYAYLVCARQRVNSGDIEGTEEYLKLSIAAGGEKPEHDKVRAEIDRLHGLAALRKGELETALTMLQLAYARGMEQSDREAVSASLTQFAYEMHGRGEDVRALASLDAALAIYPRNRQAEILRRDIWMWDYGAWIVVALVVFGVAIYFVFRQWREVKLRDSLMKDW